MKCIVPVSGGKDSQASLKLAVEAYGSPEVQGLFCDTCFEHPDTYAHIETISRLYGVTVHRICEGSVEGKVMKYKRFPSALARFCTSELKILPSKRFYVEMAMAYGPFEVWYGMRTGEGSARASRYAGKVGGELYPPHEMMSKYPKKLAKMGVMFRLPIIDWSEKDVFEYLDGEENPLYRRGFCRVGCFPCLAGGDKTKEQAFNYDETGKEHREIVRRLEVKLNKSIWTSKGGQERNGCSFCEI